MELQLGFVQGGDVQAVVERLYQSPPGVMVRAGDRLGESAGQVDLRAAAARRARPQPGGHASNIDTAAALIVPAMNTASR
jgi:hypothetical protein